MHVPICFFVVSIWFVDNLFSSVFCTYFLGSFYWAKIYCHSELISESPTTENLNSGLIDNPKLNAHPPPSWV
jgi:hypothetical protein